MSRYEQEIMKAIDNDSVTEKIDSLMNKRLNWKDGIELTVCVVCYLSILRIIASHGHTSPLNGVYAQGIVLICVFLVSKYGKKGYCLAICMNLLQMAIVVGSLLSNYNPTKIPGLFVPTGTIIIGGVLLIYNNRLRTTVSYVNNQRQEVIGLSEEIAQMNEELEQSNQELNNKNRVILQDQQMLEHTAYYDDLTDLPNRKLVLKTIEESVVKAEKTDSSFAVVVLNLDRFKQINEMLGHNFGDEFLKLITRRIRKSANAQDFIGRIGGDEFAIVGGWNLSEEECLHHLIDMKEQVCKGASVNGMKVNIDFSAGIIRYPDGGDTGDALMKNVCISLHHAKENERGSICVFNKQLQMEFKEKLVLETVLKTAVDQGQFRLVYQPQFFAHTQKVRGVEALLRLELNSDFSVGPAKFIPIVEQLGLMPQLGRWVLEQTMEMLIRAKEEFGSSFIASVNISVVQLMQPDFLDIVRELIEQYEIDPKLLEFEITESVLITSPEQASEVVSTLKEWGIRISLDDFGTGYSSLSYLTTLPIDTLKIDKSFVDTLIGENEKKHVIDTIMTLAHDMGMDIVAEGVEEQEQLEYLRDRKCDYIQGYLWSKPVSEKDFFCLMRE